jgi:hypothetical protein
MVPPGTQFARRVGMKPTLLVVSIALALGTLAGCDRNPDSTPSTGATPPAGTAGTGSSTTPNTPANAGAPNAAEKKEGANPVQGQVDPKQEPQKNDFQMKGDGAGPKPGG